MTIKVQPFSLHRSTNDGLLPPFLPEDFFAHASVASSLYNLPRHHSSLTFVMPLTRIRELALIIADKTADIDGKLESAGLPTPSFIVQDQLKVVQEGRAKLPTGLQGHVAFMEHDFFLEQPVKSADVYLLRWILHDWPDAYAIKILRALVPALKPGARVCICEQVLPEFGSLSPYQARGLRSMDLAMLEFHNAKERDVDDWAHLLREADRRFHILDTKQPPGSRLSVIEVCWLSPGLRTDVTNAKEK